MIVEFVVHGVVFVYEILYLLFLYLVKFSYIVMSGSNDSFLDDSLEDQLKELLEAERLKDQLKKKRNASKMNAANSSKFSASKSHLSEMESSFSPIRASMMDVRRNIQKMSLILQRASPKKNLFSSVDLSDQEARSSSQMSDRSSSSTLNKPSQRSNPLKLYKPNKQPIKQVDEPTEECSLECSLEKIDSILENFVSKVRDASPIKKTSSRQLDRKRTPSPDQAPKRLFKRRETVTKSDRVLVPDSDEEFEDAQEYCKPKTSLKKKTSLFKNRETIGLKAGKILAPCSDEESDLEMRENRNSNAKKPSSSSKKNLFKPRETIAPKFSKVFALDSDEESPDSQRASKVSPTKKKKFPQVDGSDSDEEVIESRNPRRILKDSPTKKNKIPQVVPSDSDSDVFVPGTQRSLIPQPSIRNKTAIEKSEPMKFTLFKPRKDRNNLMEEFNANVNSDEEYDPANAPDPSKKRNDRRQLKGLMCKQCQDYYATRTLTDFQLKKLIHQCSRHREHFHKPSKVPDDYFEVGFKSDSPVKSSTTPRQRTAPTKSPQPVARAQTLVRSKTVDCAPSTSSEFDKDDYEAWKADLQSRNAQILNSTQI